MREPGPRRAVRPPAAAPGPQRLAKRRVEQNAGPFAADDQLDMADIAFCADIQAPAANQGIAGEQCKVEQQLDRALGQLVARDHPAELDPPLRPEHAFERGLRFVGVDLVPEPAAGTERQAEEFELVGRGPRAVGEQLQAPFAHVGVGLVGEQFDAVIERADRRHQVVAKPRAEQTGKIDRVHRR